MAHLFFIIFVQYTLKLDHLRFCSKGNELHVVMLKSVSDTNKSAGTDKKMFVWLMACVHVCLSDQRKDICDLAIGLLQKGWCFQMHANIFPPLLSN